MSKRIVFVQSGLGAGGAEKIVNLIAKHRITAGDQVFVLAFHDTPETSYFEYPSNVVLRTMKDEFDAPVVGWKGFVRQVLWLRRTVKEITPHVVVSFLTKINAISAIALIGTKPQLIVSERNNPQKQRPGRIWKSLISFTFRRANRIVMQTASAQRQIHPHAQEKSRVIGNPCTLPKVPLHSSAPGKHVVAVGRLTQQKGFDQLIVSFETVVRTHPDATLTIWGEGQDRGALEALVRDKGLADKIALPGITQENQAWVDPNAIFALSSLYEGFPNVLAEALAAGMPSVAYDCDWGPSDLIEDKQNGLLVPTGDTAALANAILTLMDYPEQREALVANARARSKTYSTGTVLRQWDEAIDDAFIG
jgi:glycosyltransferase involved in cell wall biosynthesis